MVKRSCGSSLINAPIAPPSAPKTLVTGTRTSSKNSSDVSDDRCPSFWRFLPRRKPGLSASNKNEAHSSRTTLRRGPNHDNHKIAHLSVRDEGLLARDHKFITLAYRPGADALQITSTTGFGHRDGAHGFARHHLRQPFFLLFGASVAEQIAAAHVIMNGEVRGWAGEAGVAEFFDYDRVVPKVPASTAELFGDLRTKQAALATSVPKRPLDDAGVLPSLKIGRNLRCSKAPYRFPELLMLFVINRAMGQHRGIPVCSYR